jgi:hypothetical protein
MAKKKRATLGKLPPKYRFFLNPYQDYRFTSCPQCDRKMKVRKHPFFVHVDPQQVVILNMSGNYCPNCDLLILHQDKVEELLTAALLPQNPDLIGNEYLIVGTIERQRWRKARAQPHNLRQTFEQLHDFKEVVIFEVQHYGWGPAAK